MVGALLASAAATVYSVNEGRKATAQNKEAGRIEQASQSVEANRQRRMAARQARIRQAQIAQISVNTGVNSSSGRVSAEGAVQRGLAENQGYLFGSQVTADALSAKYQKAADYQFRSSVGSSLAGLALSAAPVAEDVFGGD